MKKALLLALSSMVCQFAIGQTKTVTVDANDVLNSNTKIVAQTTTVQTFFTGHQLGAGYSNPSNGIFRAWTDNPDGTANIFYEGIKAGTPTFRVRADGQAFFGGNVGIGKISPVSPLDINGVVRVNGPSSNLDVNSNWGNLSNLVNSGQMLFGWNRIAGRGEADFVANQGLGDTGGFAFFNHDNNDVETQLMFIQGNGNVSIGTADAKGYKLAVNGSAVATSVTVKVHSAWPDFVFKEDYRLPSLREVQTYIDHNGHLPEVPSAEQIAKDGLNVGEMNSTLVKKVEELTLYLIEKDKQLQKQQAEIDELKTQMKSLLKQ